MTAQVFIREWQRLPHTPTAPGHSERARKTEFSRADVYVGILLGLLAASNLVQGLWLPSLPWLDLTTVSIVLLFPLVLVQLVRVDIVRPNLHFVAILGFAIVLGFYAASLNPGASEKRLAIIPGVLLTLAAGYVLLTNTSRVKAFAAVLVVQAYVVAFAQIVLPDASAEAASGRRSPIGLNAIGSGRILAAGAVILLCVGLQQLHTKRGRLSITMAVPLLVGAGATGSRGPLAAALITLLFVGLRQKRMSKVGRIGALVAGAALVGSLVNTLSAEGSRLTDLSDPGRQHLLAQSATVALEHPLGVGWGNLYNHLPVWALSPTQGYKQYPHNVLVEFLVEGGWIAGLLLVIFAAGVLKNSWALAAVPTARILSGLATFSFVNAFLSSDIIGNRMLWVVAGAALAMTRTSMTGQDGA